MAAVATTTDPAKLFLNWVGLQGQSGPARMHMGEARVPIDASERVREKMLASAIGQWLRWQSGRGWRLVSDVRVGKPRPTLDTRTGKTIPGSVSYALTGTFQFSGKIEEAKQ